MAFKRYIALFFITNFPLFALPFQCFLFTSQNTIFQILALIWLISIILIVSIVFYHKHAPKFIHGAYFTNLMLACLYFLALSMFSLEETQAFGYAVHNDLINYLIFKMIFLFIGVIALPAAYTAYIQKRP